MNLRTLEIQIMATTNNDLTGYMGNVQLPSNPYDGTNVFHKNEKWQTEADINMAQYNNQVHEAELLKQRQWALEDRDYNSPAAMRKRLEEAGYNAALMSGMVQTANQPVRAASANSPSGSQSNLSGYANATQQSVGNVLQAGKNLVDSWLATKQAQSMDAQINLANSQSVKTLTESAKTDQDRRQSSDLFNYQKQALMSDIMNKNLDADLKYQELSELVPLRIARLQKENQLTDTQIQEINTNMGNRTKLTNAQVSEIQQGIRESAQRIIQSKETVKQIQQAVDRGDIAYASEIISLEVQNATKFAQKAQPYVNIVTEGISNVIGIGKLGQASKAMKMGQQQFNRSYDQRERQYNPNSSTQWYDASGNRTGSTDTQRY